MRGAVCVLGGTLHISLISFFCSVASGLIYILLLFAVPHTIAISIKRVDAEEIWPRVTANLTPQTSDTV